MKKTLLIISILFIGISLNAQSIKLYHGEDEITTDTIMASDWDEIATLFLTSHFKIENTSSSTLNVGLKVYYLEHLEGTLLQVCAATACVVIPGSFYEFESPISIGANQTLEGADGIHDNFNPGDNWFVTSGMVRYTVYNEADRLDSTSVVVKYLKETGTVGIEENNSIDAIYPNPANNYLTIDYSFAMQNAVAEIYTVIGAKIRNINIDHTQNSVNLDTSNLPNGIYYIRFNAQGKSFRTEKFIVNHN